MKSLTEVTQKFFTITPVKAGFDDWRWIVKVTDVPLEQFNPHKMASVQRSFYSKRSAEAWVAEQKGEL